MATLASACSNERALSAAPCSTRQIVQRHWAVVLLLRRSTQYTSDYGRGGVQACEAAVHVERALRQEAESRSSSAQADSERRAAAFKSAVGAATAVVQSELDRTRDGHARQVRIKGASN